jgi:carbonic anhydrase
MPAEPERHHRLCELNVLEQVTNVSQTTVVSEAWGRGRTLAVHGWIYKVTDGLLRDLGLCVTGPDAARPAASDVGRAS